MAEAVVVMSELAVATEDDGAKPYATWEQAIPLVVVVVVVVIRFLIIIAVVVIGIPVNNDILLSNSSIVAPAGVAYTMLY